MMDIDTYVLDADQLAKLAQLANMLNSRDDKSRDVGHILWLLVKDISENKIKL